MILPKTNVPRVEIPQAMPQQTYNLTGYVPPRAIPAQDDASTDNEERQSRRLLLPQVTLPEAVVALCQLLLA